VYVRVRVCVCDFEVAAVINELCVLCVCVCLFVCVTL